MRARIFREFRFFDARIMFSDPKCSLLDDGTTQFRKSVKTGQPATHPWSEQTVSVLIQQPQNQSNLITIKIYDMVIKRIIIPFKKRRYCERVSSYSAILQMDRGIQGFGKPSRLSLTWGNNRKCVHYSMQCFSSWLLPFFFFCSLPEY